MKLKISAAFFIVLCFSFVPVSAFAQYWHAMPAVGMGDAASAGFSSDGKKIFYLKTDGGVANIWSMVIADKYGGIIASPKTPVSQITHFTDRGVARFLPLLSRPEIVFMRLTANGKDYHIYRIKDDGSGDAQDLTSGADGITNDIIGASYNGRYIYYTSNAVNRDKVDCYRYDTQQFTSDLIFPNDRAYTVIAWTRDQNKLLLEDSANHAYIIYDIETTDRTPLEAAGNNILSVGLDPRDPVNPAGYKLETLGFKIYPNSNEKIDSNMMKAIAMKSMRQVDYSFNCKYRMMSMLSHPGMSCPTEVATGTCLPIPQGASVLAFSPKETLLLYALDKKLYLYDIAKNASIELAALQ